MRWLPWLWQIDKQNPLFFHYWHEFWAPIPKIASAKFRCCNGANFSTICMHIISVQTQMYANACWLNTHASVATFALRLILPHEYLLQQLNVWSFTSSSFSCYTYSLISSKHAYSFILQTCTCRSTLHVMNWWWIWICMFIADSAVSYLTVYRISLNCCREYQVF